MTRSGSIILISVLGLVLSMVLAVLSTPGGLELNITLVKGNTPVLILPLNPGERFTLHYYHSVEHAPIWEEHSMDKDGNIFIEEERYEKFGAGMGKMPGKGRMTTKGIYEAITDIHIPVGNFILRVGDQGVDHTIIWRGISYNLSETIPHQAVQFSGRPVSMLHQIWRSYGFRQKGRILNTADK